MWFLNVLDVFFFCFWCWRFGHERFAFPKTGFRWQVQEAEKAVEAAAELAVPLQELMASEERRGEFFFVLLEVGFDFGGFGFWFVFFPCSFFSEVGSLFFFCEVVVCVCV